MRRGRRRATGDRRALHKALPRQPNLLPPPPRHPTCPRRPIADRSGNGLRNANEGAPLPRLGQIPSSDPQRAFSALRASAAASRGGAFAHSSRRGRPTARCAAGARRRPGAAACATLAARDIARRLGDRTGQPKQHHREIRHHRHRPRDHVGQRRSRQPSGADGLRRHLRLLQRPRPAMAVQHADAQPGRCPVQYHQRAEWRCRQPILRLTAVGPRPLQADHQQHQVGADRRRASFPLPASPPGGAQYLNFMSIKSWDANGAWTTNFSAIAVSPDNGERWGVYPDSVRVARPDAIPGGRYVPGNENFQQGAFLKPGPGDPYIYSFGTPSGRGGSAYVARVLPALCAGSHDDTNTGTPTKMPGSQPIRGLPRR